MIQPGQILPTDFSLRVVACDGEPRESPFRDLLTRRTIVSIYMRNNTGSCDRQIDSLVAHAAEIERRGWNLVALSRDTCGSHRKYAAKKQVPHLLASDPEDRFARAADAIVEKQMYGRRFSGLARAAFLLDRDGTVLAVVEKVDPKAHAEQLLAEIARLEG